MLTLAAIIMVQLCFLMSGTKEDQLLGNISKM